MITAEVICDSISDAGIRLTTMALCYPKYIHGEVMTHIESWGLGFALGNCVKYIARAGRKGDRLEDLKKARWYLDREISNLSSTKDAKHV